MERTITIDCGRDCTAADIARKLKSVSGYREKSMNTDHAVVKVGSEFMARMIGVYITTNYTAP